MTVHKTAGTLYYIGPVVDAESIEDMTDEDAVSYFDGLSGWTEIEEIESFGDFGDNSDVVTFASVKDRRVRKFKTTRDAGTMTVMCGRDPLDAGQIALAAAEKTDSDYAFKVVFPDTKPGFTNSTEYFGGMVMSRPTNLGGVGDMTKRTYNVAVNTAVYAVDSEAESVPTNTARPSITGASVQVGVTLTANEGAWTGLPTSYTYQWQHDDGGDLSFANVSVGGTNKTYVPVVGDIGDSLRVQVTAINGAGSSSAANSLATTVIIAA